MKFLREKLRSFAIGVLRRVGRAPETRGIAAATLEGLLHTADDLRDLANRPVRDYPELGGPRTAQRVSMRGDCVLISARFRSGSTLLWNLFRHVEGVTAYFEPFHPRLRLPRESRGGAIDATHRHVDDYWREYDAIGNIDRIYRVEWHSERLFLDARRHEPEIKSYLETLIGRAPGRPVLQFNRADFRLPWLARAFPNASIVHLYRHPRDQWLSFLKDWKAFPPDGDLATFFADHDHYSIREWVEDLNPSFPFLDWSQCRHPYAMHYLLWKLSYLFGQRYAHFAVSYERLIGSPRAEIERLFAAIGVENADIEALSRLVEPQPRDKWRAYADEDWFREQESRCEEILCDALGASAREFRAATTLDRR